MSTADRSDRSPARRLMRRIAGSMLLALLLFTGLWLTMFGAATSALISFGLGGGMVVAGSVSDGLSGIVDFIVEAVLGVFSFIGDAITSFLDG